MTPFAQKKSRKQNPSKTIAKKTKYDEMLHKFLDEDEGRVTHLELDCLKPRVGNGNTLYIAISYPAGQEDKFLYPIWDVFGGPVNVAPVPRQRSWRVENLDKVESFLSGGEW